ncbi:MAG: hypothetical protein R3B35_11280 [Gemmatimonadales bacterium]
MSDQRRGRYRYTIKLKGSVKSDKKFREQNPGYEGRKPCYYVGTSIHEPEVRFKQHLAGYKAARIAKKFGVRLEAKYCKRLGTSDTRSAEKKEAAYAAWLRKQGYGVYQN